MRLHSSGPAHGEIGRAHHRTWPGRAPVEIDRGIRLHQNRRAGERTRAGVIREIRAGQADAGARRRRVDERGAGNGAVDRAGRHGHGLNHGVARQIKRPDIKRGTRSRRGAVQRVKNRNSRCRIRQRDLNGIGERAARRRNGRRRQKNRRAINRQRVFCADVNFAAGDHRHGHFHRTARIVACEVHTRVV